VANRDYRRHAAPRLWALIAVLALAACAQRGEIQLDPGAGEVGSVQEIKVASLRAPDPTGPGFGVEIAPRLTFAEFKVSVPPERTAGTVTFPARNGRPDPSTDFLTVAADAIPDEAGFVASVNAALASRPPAARDVFVFVHGFNVTFAEGLYRQAQMSHDFKAPGVSINFAWPSAGRVSAYATDREAVFVARDGLQDLLRLLARTKAKRIVVMGHSMGAMLVMETMRQTALVNDRAVLAKTDAVVLMAADVDIDVFRAQMGPLAARNVDVFLFTSSRDTALRLSARLRGSSERLGGVTDASQFAGLPVTVIDLSEFQGEEDALGHFKVATSPAMISLFQGLGAVGLDILRDQPASVGLVEAGAGLFTETAAVLTEPLAPR
jgi:esterase/lipase superfamily enzyme